MQTETHDPYSVLFAELEQKILQASPDLGGYLEKLKMDIKATPEMVWKLKPEQVGLIIRGAAVHSRIAIEGETAGKKSKKADIAAVSGVLDMLNLPAAPALPKKQEAKAVSDIFAGLNLESLATAKLTFGKKK